jgi:GAF domain-containing protein
LPHGRICWKCSRGTGKEGEIGIQRDGDELRIQLDSLLGIERSVHTTLSLNEVLERLHAGLGELVDTSTSLIGLYDQETDSLRYPILYDRGERFHLDDPVKLSHGVNTWAIRNRCSLLLGSEEEYRAYLGDGPDERIGEEGDAEQSFLVVPIMLDEEVLGVVNLQSYEKDAFDENDRRLLELVADKAAAAINNARVHEALEAAVRRAEGLQNVARRLAEPTTLREALDLVLAELGALVACETAVLMLEESGKLRVEAATGPGEEWEVGLVFDPRENPVLRRTLESRSAVDLTGERVRIRDETFARVGELDGWLVVPIVYKEEPAGLIALNCPGDDPTPEPVRRLSEAFAGHAAVAIENARLLDYTRRRAEQATSLLNLGMLVLESHAPGDIQGLFETMIRELREKMDYRLPGIYTVETLPEGRFLVLQGCSTGEELPRRLPVSEERGIMGRAVLTGSTVFVPDVERDPGYLPSVPGVISEVAVPVRIEEEVAAVLNVESDSRTLDELDVELLELFAQQLGSMLRNERNFDEIRRANRELEVLHRIGRDIGSALEVGEVLREVIAALRGTFGYRPVVCTWRTPSAGCWCAGPLSDTRRTSPTSWRAWSLAGESSAAPPSWKSQS